MIKLIASDLDGTLLLNKAQTLPEDLFPLIRALNELGIRFVAASGRQYPNMKRLFAPVASDISFICENGALAVEKGQVLYQDRFDKELANEILTAIIEKKDAEFTCSAKDYHYLMPKTESFRHYMVDLVKNECRIINSLDEITEPIMKLAVYESAGLTDEYVRYWTGQFGQRCTVVTSGNDWVDFIPFDTNKAKGVEKYQEILGIRPEECIVFGDEYNDIAMLKSVPYSFAMAHAKDGVKQAAAYETERVETILKKLITAKGNIEEVLK